MRIHQLIVESYQTDIANMFRKFLPLAMEVLELESLPQFVFEREIDTGSQPSFGMYDADNRVLYVALANRHPVDILRTVAHELVHYKQDLLDQLQDDSGKTGSPEENQANELAGVVLRYFNKQYPEFLKIKPLVLESRLKLAESLEDQFKFDLDLDRARQDPNWKELPKNEELTRIIQLSGLLK